MYLRGDIMNAEKFILQLLWLSALCGASRHFNILFNYALKPWGIQRGPRAISGNPTSLISMVCSFPRQCCLLVFLA